MVHQQSNPRKHPADMQVQSCKATEQLANYLIVQWISRRT